LQHNVDMTVLRLIPSNLSHYHPLVKCLKNFSWACIKASSRVLAICVSWKIDFIALFVRSNANG
jgi:hypothetical protein